MLNKAFTLANSIDPHKTAPNPRVGCVVFRGEEVLAIGCHRERGGGHAEVDALKQLEGQDISDCTIYVTLEPCACFVGKKTGSCTQLLINKKPQKLIIGSLDPRFSGVNVEKIKDAGIEVEVLNNDDHESLNKFYDHFFYTKKTYICMKVAQSLDGCVKPLFDKQEKEDRYQKVSNALSRKKVHQMRAQYSAILTTVKTINDDNAKLDVRSGEGSNPNIIVLGKKGDIPADAEFWNVQDREVHFFNTHDLSSVIDQCSAMGIDSIMTECGPTVMTELLKQDLVDEVVQFIAPTVYGSGLPVVNDEIDFSRFKLKSLESLEGDVMVRWKKESRVEN